MQNDSWVLAGKTYHSRLLVGTGKYKDLAETKAVVEASGAEIITVALRRMDLSKKETGSILDVLPPDRYTYLPNSAGCHTAEEAVRTLKLARELGGWNLVKLEVIQKNNNLLPDPQATVEAANQLVADGFQVMAYTNDDPEVAKRLEDIGCAAVMPLASPIGSGLGIIRPDNIRRIVERAKVPILVDAGIGTASDAAIAMELGCSAVLLNTAIASAGQPIVMAEAMKLAVMAGRKAFLAGRMPKQDATASSPTSGIIGK
ncbi:MAG: thiazole synthase [Rickettsiales bacterium]|nr:thiazole synthase [Rickettsiales bacterium]